MSEVLRRFLAFPRVRQQSGKVNCGTEVFVVHRETLFEDRYSQLVFSGFFINHAQIEKGGRGDAVWSFDRFFVDLARLLSLVQLFIGSTKNDHGVNVFSVLMLRQRFLQYLNRLFVVVLSVLAHEHLRQLDRVPDIGLSLPNRLPHPNQPFLFMPVPQKRPPQLEHNIRVPWLNLQRLLVAQDRGPKLPTRIVTLAHLQQ